MSSTHEDQAVVDGLGDEEEDDDDDDDGDEDDDEDDDEDAVQDHGQRPETGEL